VPEVPSLSRWVAFIERITLRFARDDRRHQATCDWNLYREQRFTNRRELCNIDCRSRPEQIKASWAKPTSQAKVSDRD
jgi:hypothetical protein